MDNNYKGMAIAIIILACIHIILSIVFSVVAYRKGLRKEGGAWLLSFCVCVAILVLAAVATGQNDNYTNNRINFYLGTELINEPDVDKQLNVPGFTDIKTLDSLDRKQKIYEEPLANLLAKTNNRDKKFKVLLGDNRHITDKYTLVKNRAANNQNSVILKCLEFDRHWNLYYNKPKDKPFETKIDKIFWRGASTGNDVLRSGNRFDLIKKWFNKDANIDVGFSQIVQPDVVTKHIPDIHKYVKDSAEPETFLNYKYILSIEGNDKDSGINWKLNSNSLVLMPKPQITSWLMETTLIPFYHYVLIKDDYSDLREVLDWCRANQSKCKQIIENSTIFMSQFSNKAKEEKIEKKVINKYFKLTENIKLKDN